MAELWENGISAEILMKAGPKIQPQLKYCSRNHIPFSVILSKQDLAEGKVGICFLFFVFCFCFCFFFILHFDSHCLSTDCREELDCWKTRNG